jgi:hypothetical protein
MKRKYQVWMKALAAPTVLALVTTMAHAQYYSLPGGYVWGYTYSGDAAAAGSGGTAFDSLDGTWNHSSATGPGDSDNWDGSGLGGTLGVGNAPGGVQTGTDGGVNFLRIQDPGSPSAVTYGSVNNNVIAFGRNLTGVVQDNFVDAGVTLHFRVRVPSVTLDNRDSGGTTSPYPAGGDGYGTFGNGLGGIYVKNSSGASPDGGVGPGAIGFALGVANDDWPTSPGTSGNGPALYMNNLYIDSLNNRVDWGEGWNGTTRRTGTGPGGLYIDNALPVADATQWNEFWINIAANDSTPGNGTHTVTIYANGSLTPSVFNVTGGNNNQDYQQMASMGMALAHNPGSGAMDVDYYSVMNGIWSPAEVPEPTAIVLTGLGLLALAARFRRFRRN